MDEKIYIGDNLKNEIDEEIKKTFKGRHTVEIYKKTSKFHKRGSIKILYIDNNEYIYRGNKDILIARSKEDIIDILNFYNKYDYKTLERIK